MATFTGYEPDFVGNAGILTFQAGETQKTIDLQIIDDLLGEGSETFGVKLSGAEYATLAKDEVIVTITDNEDLPSISVFSDVSRLEGSSTNSAATTTFSF